MVAHRLHPEHPDPVSHEHRQDVPLEAVVVGVHRVERHLHRVETEAVARSHLEHLQVDLGALVPGETDVADLARLFGLEHRFHCPARRKNTLGIVHPDDLVELQEVDVVGLEPAEGFFDLPRRRVPIAPVDLGHQKRALPVPVAQRLAHSDLALPAIVIPAVVEKGDSAVDRGADEADAVRLPEVWLAEVKPAEPDRGDAFPRAPERAVGNLTCPFRPRRGRRDACRDRGGGRDSQELPAGHRGIVRRHITVACVEKLRGPDPAVCRAESSPRRRLCEYAERSHPRGARASCLPFHRRPTWDPCAGADWGPWPAAAVAVARAFSRDLLSRHH